MAELPGGIGNNDQASQVTAYIRQQPWYTEWLAKNGIAPGPDQQVALTKQQRKDLANLAVANGIGLNNKFDQFDENGQVSEAHHKLKKTLIAAAIGGAALTGFGAAGIGPLAGALSGGASAAAGGAAAIPTTSGIASATALGLPVTAGLGTAGTAAATGGLGAALTTGAKLAGLAGKVGGALSNGGADDEGLTPSAPQDSANAAKADQLALNRYLETPQNQAGVQTDVQVMRNQMRAALVSRMNPNGPTLSAGKYALPNLNPTQGAVDFNSTFADELRKRQLAGQPMTLSGTQPASAEELAARKAAENASGTGEGANSTAARVGNVINQGSRYAKLGMGIYRGIKDIF